MDTILGLLGLILFVVIMTITLIQRRVFGSAPEW